MNPSIENRLFDVLRGDVPRIANALERIAAALEGDQLGPCIKMLSEVHDQLEDVDRPKEAATVFAVYSRLREMDDARRR